MQVQGKVFVITGAGNGMGREIALLLLKRGAKVAAVDLSEEGLNGTVELAGAASDRIATFAVNITDRAAVEALPAQVEAALGAVDGLVNVAGIIHRFAKIQELSVEEIERVVNVNFWGTVYMVKTFLPTLLARPEASLVDFASMGGLVPVPGQGAYGASKGAVKLFTETLFAELQGTNVHVSAVFPGGMSTNIAGNSGLDVAALMAGQSKGGKAPKMPKTTTPQDAAAIVVDAIEKNTFRVLIGGDAKALDRLGRIAPTRAITTVANQMKALLG